MINKLCKFVQTYKMPQDFLPPQKQQRAVVDNTNSVLARNYAMRFEKNVPTNNKLSKVEKFLSNGLKKATPFVPNNVGTWARKKVGLPTEIDDKSLNHFQRGALYKMVENAVKRTGNNQGGTEYEDYETTPEAKEYIMKAKHGDINPIIGTYLGLKDPAYDMATTTGRGNYTKNPDGTIHYTDRYDFKNQFTQDSTGSLKENYMKNRNDYYGKERKQLAIDAQKDSGLHNTIDINLNPTDTIGYSQYLKDRGDFLPLIDTKKSIVKKGTKLSDSFKAKYPQNK